MRILIFTDLQIMSSQAAELRKLESAQRSLAISQRAVSSALLEAKRHRRSKAAAATRTAKRRKSRKSKGKK